MEAILDIFYHAWSKKLLCIFSSSVTNFRAIHGSIHLKTITVGSVFLCLRGQGKDFLPIRLGKKTQELQDFHNILPHNGINGIIFVSTADFNVTRCTHTLNKTWKRNGV